MEATRITQHGKIYFPTPTHAIETQQKLQAAGLRHVGNHPDRINENAVGLHWGDGLYFTTDRVEVFKRYPGPQYKQVEFQTCVETLTSIAREGHRTQKAMREGLIAEITPLVVESMQEALKRFPMMGRKKKVNVEERRAGWKCFVGELKKRRDKYVLAHVRVVLKEHFPNVTQLYDSTFSAYYREVQ
jgi:hypothetical protein